jgi:hypothetical protein
VQVVWEKTERNGNFNGRNGYNFANGHNGHNGHKGHNSSGPDHDRNGEKYK